LLRRFVHNHIKGDKVLWMVMLLLSIVSTLTVYSATGALAYKYQDGNTSYYVMKHVVITFVGFVITFLIHKIDYNSIRKYAKLMLFLTIPLLLLTLVLGAKLNSASRWIAIPGIGLTFQTSDFAKFSLIIYVAYWLAKNQDEIGDFKKVFLPLVSVIGIVCVLILPANFSTAALLFSVSMVMMFVGRVRMKHIGLLVGICVIAIGLIATLIFVAPDVLPRGATWKHRIENFSGEGKEGDNFQADQSKIAIATGGIFGKGPGNSIQRNFLPHPYSDFIYAIICEEYGLIGGIFVLFLFLIIMFRAGMIIRKSEYRFPSLVAAGLAFSLAFQAMINMAVAVNLMPVTGQTLPLVSMGGSSIIFTSISFGLLLSVSRCLDKTEAKDGKADKENTRHSDKDDNDEDEDEFEGKTKHHTEKSIVNDEGEEIDVNDDDEDDEEEKPRAKPKPKPKLKENVREVSDDDLDDDDIFNNDDDKEGVKARKVLKKVAEFDPNEINPKTERRFDI